MKMAVVKLDHKEIEEKIKAGDTFNGCYVLAVAPDGSNHEIHWMENNRQWDPWPQGWLTIGIPSLFPEGSGEEYELAADCIRANGLIPCEIEAEIEESREFSGLVEYADAKFGEWMQAARDSQMGFLADSFLAACNGDGTELNDLAPWGHTLEHEGYEVIEPPAKFEWAS
jgi:hypothetical protein